MIKIDVDTSHFDKVFKEYLQYNKRTIPQIVTTKAFFIARNAVGMTAASTKEQIYNDLMKSSKIAPGAPLAAILVNKQRRKGLQGQAMADAVASFIRKRQASRNLLRAGWLQAVRAIAPHVDSKRGQPPLTTGIRLRPGLNLGGAKHAPEISNYWKATASIWNSVLANRKPGSKPDKVQKLIQEGAQKAINKETASMREYITNKLNKGIRQFNNA